MKIKYLKKTQHDRANLLGLLNYTDKLFQPPLSKRVDLQFYADKMLQEGTVVVIIGNDEAAVEYIAGCGFYCNPHKYNYAFLTYIATTRKGLGSKLLKEMIKYCKKKGSKGIETQTWESNLSSLKLFKKNGFKEINYLNNRNSDEKSIFLRLDFGEKL